MGFQPHRGKKATRSWSEGPPRPKPLRLNNSYAALPEDDYDRCGFEEYECKWPKLSAEVAKKAGCVLQKPLNKASCSGKEVFEQELKRHVLLLTKESDKMVCAVAKDKVPVQGKYRLIEAVIDSGAEESMAPPCLFAAEVKPSPMSRAGGKYRAANGARIPNLGQVAEVERPLLSASQLAASGNTVIIDKNGGRITNEGTGKSMALACRGGVYVLRMWVAAKPAPGFAGQGR
jgi:hypothetical protein